MTKENLGKIIKIISDTIGEQENKIGISAKCSVVKDLPFIRTVDCNKIQRRIDNITI